MALDLREVAFSWTDSNYPEVVSHATVAIGVYSEDQEEDDDDIFYYFSSEEEFESAYSPDWADGNDFVLVREEN